MIVTSVMIISCDSFLNVNTDPTRLKSASLTQSLVAAEGSLSFYMGSDLHLYSSIFSQQAAGSGVSGDQTRMMDQYIVANVDVNNSFSAIYAGTIADLNYIRQNAFKLNNPQHAGVAKILQAYAYSIIVDSWGNVPYKDAMKGVANVHPAYDNSQEIYDSLLVLLDAGISNIKQTNFLAIGAEDLIYGGNMAKWEKFANTLKLRLALHYANVDGGAKLNAIISAGGPFMSSNADNFQMLFEDNNNRWNPIHQFELSRQDYYAPSDFIVTMMNSKADPRRVAYYTAYAYPAATDGTNGATFQGFVPGNGQTAPNSRIHTYLRGKFKSDGGGRTNSSKTPVGGSSTSGVVYAGDAPQRMLTFAEYNFIMAEAVLMYGAPGNAGIFLKAGIDASIADAAAWATSKSPVVPGTYSTTASATVTLKNIIEEKFVANVGVPLESWSDWRRTGFPAIAPSVAATAVGNTTIPRILVYPLSEQQANAANVPDRASMSLKGVFWDK